jgi:hypothetical protein
MRLRVIVLLMLSAACAIAGGAMLFGVSSTLLATGLVFLFLTPYFAVMDADIRELRSTRRIPSVFESDRDGSLPRPPSGTIDPTARRARKSHAPETRGVPPSDPFWPHNAQSSRTIWNVHTSFEPEVKQHIDEMRADLDRMQEELLRSAREQFKQQREGAETKIEKEPTP